MSKHPAIDEATRSEYRAYVQRWKLFNEFRSAEANRQTPEQRLRQFFKLLNWAREMNWSTSTDAEIAEVRDRWKRLREALRE